ncbi:MAG: hypothetical protein P8X73_18215, partial [Ignavibacteriaceae bacterium]
MKQRIINLNTVVIIIWIFNSALFFAQTITINTGTNQIINWEITHSTKLSGKISSNKIKTEWTCPQNSEVVFKDPSNPVTEVHSHGRGIICYS